MHSPLRLLSLKGVCFCCLLNNFEASLTNSVDADQTAPVGSVQSGSTLFVSIFMLNNYQTLFCCRFEVYIITVFTRVVWYNDTVNFK